MKHKLFYDTETFNATPINRGTDVYARDAEVTIATYALDDGPVRCWDATEIADMPADLREPLADPGVLKIAHNATFDRLVTRHALGIDIPPEQWYDTMVQALAHSLPAALGLLCEVIGVDEELRKHDGKDLIHLFCKPLAANRKLDRATRHTHPEEWERFKKYAINDTAAMREAHKKMPTCNYRGRELKLWWLDQRINDRGICIDTDFAEAAVRHLKNEKAEHNAQITEMTEGEVTAATQRDKLLKHLVAEHGVYLEDMKSATLESWLEEDWLEDSVKEMIRVRLLSSKTSTAKYQRVLNLTGPDGRIRYTMQFNGADRTGRDAGRGLQPQNLPRPKMDAEDIERCIELIREDEIAGVQLFAPSLREACSDALRGLIVAPPGRKLVVSDWSNIEGRVLAWLASEEWKLQAFRDSDAGVGQDLYKLIFSKSFGKKPGDVDKDERQIGKGEELSLGFGGGVGAFLSVAASYGLDLEWLARVVPETAPRRVLDEAKGMWGWACRMKKTAGLPYDQYIACETIKRLYREANPNIESLWHAYEDAAFNAVMNPGQEFRAGRCVFKRAKNWLKVRLPSGRHLMYASPKIRQEREKIENEDGSAETITRSVLTYMGRVNKGWREVKTYGGKIAENVTQAVANDVLRWAMPIVEDAGFEIVLRVHDELVTEVDENSELGIVLLNELMCTEHDWFEGTLPVAADGYEGTRYRKD